MTHSQNLADAQTRHANARMMGQPVSSSPALPISKLSPLTWAASNNQHAVHNKSLLAMNDSDADAWRNGQHDVNFNTWGMYNFQF